MRRIRTDMGTTPRWAVTIIDPESNAAVSAAPKDPTAMAPSALLRLLQLVSPALPVGAYAYSQGLEYAVSANWVFDEESTFEWLHGVGRLGVGSLDLPILLRLHRSCLEGDEAQVRRWTARLIASRETQELRAEDLQMGRALARILADCGLEDARTWERGRPAFATLFALACARWGIGRRETLAGYMWSWTENQVLAAVRLVPLGQTAGQRLLQRLSGGIPSLLERALAVSDEQIGSSAISQLLASSLHETQYTRLFRS